jgi:orotidine-5'-phosphate decarboxylase
MKKEVLLDLIRYKKSFLCVGLDSDPEKFPAHLQKEDDPVFAFNKAIIDATLPYAVAYKPNMAFYESRGADGWRSLERTMDYLQQLEPRPFIIADAKRGDIGNTSAMYARAFFQHLNADGVTLSPYMGEDTVSPFLNFPDKWAVILALTSNKSARDFQMLRPRQSRFGKLFCRRGASSRTLYECVLRRAMQWGSPENTMFVVGATQAERLEGIRKIVPEHFLLVPGVGSQGGSLEDVARYGLNKECGLLVNASRSILFASKGEDFAEAAAAEAKKMQTQMAGLLAQFSRLGEQRNEQGIA